MWLLLCVRCYVLCRIRPSWGSQAEGFSRWKAGRRNAAFPRVFVSPQDLLQRCTAVPPCLPAAAGPRWGPGGQRWVGCVPSGASEGCKRGVRHAAHGRWCSAARQLPWDPVQLEWGLRRRYWILLPIAAAHNGAHSDGRAVNLSKGCGGTLKDRWHSRGDELPSGFIPPRCTSFIRMSRLEAFRV